LDHGAVEVIDFGISFLNQADELDSNFEPKNRLLVTREFCVAALKSAL
jgi:hypothetical protein